MSFDGTPLVRDIIGETDRLGHLVGYLLALASVESGAVALDVMPVPVEGWFEDLMQRVAKVVGASGLRLRPSVAEEASGLDVLGDRDRLDQLVLILVANAIEHSHPGGAVQLDLVADRSAGRVRVLVADDGPAIPPAKLERIFELFAQVPGSQRVKGWGGPWARHRQPAGWTPGRRSRGDQSAGQARHLQPGPPTGEDVRCSGRSLALTTMRPGRTGPPTLGRSGHAPMMVPAAGTGAGTRSTIGRKRHGEGARGLR